MYSNKGKEFQKLKGEERKEINYMWLVEEILRFHHLSHNAQFTLHVIASEQSDNIPNEKLTL